MVNDSAVVEAVEADASRPAAAAHATAGAATADLGNAVFAALADPTRRRVIQLLGGESLRAGELANRTGSTRPAMSRHLRLLREAGLVGVEFAEQDARGRAYRLEPAPLLAASAWLDQVQAQWNHQVGALAAHIADTRGGTR